MWEISVNDQVLTFIYSLVLGMMICTFYDILRALRKTGSRSYLSVFIGDIFFWIVSAFVTFIFLLSRTNGEIRGYVLISMLLGFTLWRITLSKPLFYLFVTVIGFLRHTLNKTIDLINRCTDKLAVLLTVFTGKIIKILKSLYEKLKKLLKNR